ncbi:MAG: response regulator, partial [Arenimonas sp.]|uniref:response regulator n=1 Tax=Arenimonas sp. TaxID=1872635 RepID=UPI0025B7C4C7
TDAALRQRLSLAAPGWGATLTQTDTTQDALTRLRTSVSRGAGWTFDLLLVDLTSVRSTAIALHRNLRRMPELEDLRVAYLQGDEPIANELVQGPYALLLSRMIGNTELRSGLSKFLSGPVAAKQDDPEPIAQERTLIPEATDGGEPRVGRLRGRVLLVEDNPVNLMVAQRLVGMLGLHCETADNGEKALERMYAGNLDVVLMDCQMPVKDGYTASLEWRQHESATGLARLPIIAMTANAMAGDRQKCLDAGMDDYLSKPVDRRLLEATIARWLQSHPQPVLPTAADTAPAPAPAAAPARAAAPAPAPAPAPAAQAPRPAPPVLPPRPAFPDMQPRPIVPFPPRAPAATPGLATGIPPARPMVPSAPARPGAPDSAQVRPDAPAPPPGLAPG